MRFRALGPELGLLVAAGFFGSTFVVVQDALNGAEPLTFLFFRFLLAAAALWLLSALRRSRPGWLLARLRRSAHTAQQSKQRRLDLWRDGALAGTALALGYWTQTEGLRFTSTTASAFITYLLVVFVPVLSWLLWRRRPNGWTVLGLSAALGGLFALNPTGLALGRGELLTVGCALAFAAHIVTLEARSSRHGAVELAAVQLTVVAGWMAVAATLTGARWEMTQSAWLAAAFTAWGASAVGFSLQTWAQARVESTRAALLLTTETVVAAVLGAVIGERLSQRAWSGVVLILIGVVLAELKGRVPRAETTP